MPPREITRREMMTSTIAGAAGLSCSWKLQGADDLEPVSFLIVSDTHLGRQGSPTPERQWRQAVEEINRVPGEFVLHLGDLVDSGNEAQYPIYLETRERLNKPIHEIPGNHDPDDLFRRYVRQEIDVSVDYGGLRFVLLGNAHPDSHDGFLTPEQIAWLDRQCAEAASQKLKVVVCCHVPIHTNKPPDRAWYVKPDDGQRAFYELHRRYSSSILVCLHGHFHNGIRGWQDHEQTVEVLCPSVCYNQDRGLAGHLAEGRATGFFVDELRPGFVQVELGNGRLTMHYKPLGVPPTGTYTTTWD